jgi:hypothetical protein
MPAPHTRTHNYNYNHNFNTPLCTCPGLHNAPRSTVVSPIATGPLCTTMAVATPRLTWGRCDRLAAPTARPSDTAEQQQQQLS